MLASEFFNSLRHWPVIFDLSANSDTHKGMRTKYPPDGKTDKCKLGEPSYIRAGMNGKTVLIS